VIDDRLADELERIGVEGRASILAEFAASSRVASHQIAEIIGIARRNRPADDRYAGPGSSWVWIASQLGVMRRRRTGATTRSHPQPARGPGSWAATPGHKPGPVPWWPGSRPAGRRCAAAPATPVDGERPITTAMDRTD
jgi:hypothetical protein